MSRVWALVVSIKASCSRWKSGGSSFLVREKWSTKRSQSSSNSIQNLNEPLDISDSIDEALLCILPHHNNTKLLMGAESGNISIFEWDEWITPNDTIKGHPASLNQLIQVDEK